MVEQTSGTDNTGIVYILSNPAMPNYIKVGKTRGDSADEVRKRMRELYDTGVPRAFNCEYAAMVSNYERVEKALLYAFGNFRVNPDREFLEGIDPVRVKAILQLHEIKEVTPGAISGGGSAGAGDGLVQDKPTKAENFKFSMARVPVDAYLEWADEPRKRCKVLDQNNHVEYEGETYTLSGLAKILKGWSSAQGSIYWMYGGKTLQELRQQFEEAEEKGDE